MLHAALSPPPSSLSPWHPQSGSGQDQDCIKIQDGPPQHLPPPLSLRRSLADHVDYFYNKISSGFIFITLLRADSTKMDDQKSSKMNSPKMTKYEGKDEKWLCKKCSKSKFANKHKDDCKKCAKVKDTVSLL